MNQLRSAPPFRRQFPGNSYLLSTVAMIALLLLATCPVRAEDPEGQYLQIFDTIQQADVQKKNGQIDSALAKYRNAQIALAKYQRTYPDRNAKMVAYRLNYVTTQIAALAPQASNAGTTNEPSTASKPNSTGAAQVKLLEAGAEPRAVLRFHPKPGDKHSMSMSMKIGMDIKMNGMDNPPIKLPVVNLVMDSTVTNVASDGDITYEMVLSDASITEDPEVIAQVAEAMKTAAGSAKGLSGTGTLSARGISKSSDIKMPQGADPQSNPFAEQMKDTMTRVSVPLPEEPVGVGAKWEVKMPIKSQGINLNQTESYELVSIDGDHVTAKTTVAQTAGSQKIDNPIMPGSKVELTKLTSSGTGEIALDLTQIFPPTANAKFHQELSTSATAGGQKQTMARTMDMDLHLESK